MVLKENICQCLFCLVDLCIQNIKIICVNWGSLDGISTVCTMSVYPSWTFNVMTLLVCRIIKILGLYALCMFVHWVQFILSHEVIFKCDQVCNQLRTPWTCFKWLGLNLIVTSSHPNTSVSIWHIFAIRVWKAYSILCHLCVYIYICVLACIRYISCIHIFDIFI